MFIFFIVKRLANPMLAFLIMWKIDYVDTIMENQLVLDLECLGKSYIKLNVKVNQ